MYQELAIMLGGTSNKKTPNPSGVIDEKPFLRKNKFKNLK